MKKILFLVILALSIIGCQVKNCYAANEWRAGTGANTILGSISPSDIDSDSYEDIVAPLDRLLAGYRKDCDVAYSSASAITVGTGEVVCSNSAGSIRKFRRNTSSTTVTFANLDTGSEVENTYYVYANGDADATTFTCVVSLSSSAPTGVTYYKRLGYFTNNSSLDIDSDGVIDDDASPVANGSITAAKLASNAVTNAKITDSTIDLTAKVTGTLPVGNGGTGATGTANTASNVCVLGADGYLADDLVDYTALKTAQATVTHATSTYTQKIITGGEYCFLPQAHSSTSTARGYAVDLCCHASGIGTVSLQTSATTTVGINSPSSDTITVTTRYVTASGTDWWIFLLVDKTTDEVLSVSVAKDHPSYGNGGDPNKVPHPFNEYFDKLIPHNLEIILLNKKACKKLEKISKSENKSIAALLHEDYFVDKENLSNYEPLHSGKFIDEKPIYINEIPGYVRVRDIKKLTQSEKSKRKAKKDKIIKASEERLEEEALIQNHIRKLAIEKLKEEGVEFKHN